MQEGCYVKLLIQEDDITNTDIISKQQRKTRSNHIDLSNIISLFFRFLQCRPCLQALMSAVINVECCHSVLMSYNHVVLIRPKQYSVLLNCLSSSLESLPKLYSLAY